MAQISISMAQIRDVLHPWLQKIWEVLHPWLHPTLQIHDSSSWQAIPLQVGFRNCREREKLQVILRPWSKNGFRDRDARVALSDGIEEEDSRASSSYSSHEIGEQENDRAMEGLHDSY
ncbi:uncharacterized protein LOC131007068 isoform X2 [Salvia miltiorrhiza]|uniref:uncharacterized protein LOC131007068 isoform X2 n=1 Tax=Salvia miltiorrhiza TaxID=226208 RepID=UPI0025AD46E8|nr:uncharacterized protein LOC131007068 isoform X2 [Salvia miltiorrhiza]